MGREWLHWQSESAWVFTDDGRREEAGHIKDAFGSEGLIQFVAVSRQRANTALFVLIVEQKR
jgi:hypothetical protein